MNSLSIIGVWLFSGLLYQGQTLPLPNPDLKLYFEFDASGSDILHYRRVGEVGQCRRKASYRFSGNELYQKIVWVDPENAVWCSQDPDMQMGRESVTPAWLDADHLYLRFQMGDQDIVYVMDKQNP